ncbi:MAG: hypothetical protein KHY38_09150 [Cutibacterium granulosum]|nr:hypothetical protein [Cutibacterium granulosum]
MKRTIRLEFRKMRRLRTFPITAILVIAVAGLSSFSLFAGSTQESFNDPDALPWAGLMVTYTLMAAMTSPILAAVLASRQTDIEHSGIGWTLASTAGYSPGMLCRAKLVALSAVLLPAVIVQTLLVIGIGLFAVAAEPPIQRDGLLRAGGQRHGAQQQAQSHQDAQELFHENNFLSG